MTLEGDRKYSWAWIESPPPTVTARGPQTAKTTGDNNKTARLVQFGLKAELRESLV